MRKLFGISEDNRLVAKGQDGPTILYGSFSIDEENRLVYKLNAPMQGFGEGYKKEITFNGSWNLNPNYDLELLIRDAEKTSTEEALTLRGEIIAAEGDKITFGIKSRNKDNQSQFRILSLGGVWAVDECNRIFFKLTQRDGPADILTLQGGFQLNKNQEIVYTYEKTDFATGKRSPHSIAFRGFWQLSRSQRLTYIFSADSLSKLDFRVQLESPNVYPKAGVIKYRIGIGARKEAEAGEIINLFGTWKFSRRLGLVFEMEYAQGVIHAINFGANVDLSRADEIVFNITSIQGEPLGFSLIFEHKFLEKLDAKAFLRFKELRSEHSVDAGIRIPF